MSITKLEIKKNLNPNMEICKEFNKLKSILMPPEVGINHDIANEFKVALIGGAKYYIPLFDISLLGILLKQKGIMNIEFINKAIEYVKANTTIQGNSIIWIAFLSSLMIGAIPAFSHYTFEYKTLFLKDFRDTLEEKKLQKLEKMAINRGFDTVEALKNILDEYNLHLAKKNIMQYTRDYFFESETNEDFNLPNAQTLDVYANNILVNNKNYYDILGGSCLSYVEDYFNMALIQPSQVLTDEILDEISPPLQLKKGY